MLDNPQVHLTWFEITNIANLYAISSDYINTIEMQNCFTKYQSYRDVVMSRLRDLLEKFWISLHWGLAHEGMTDEEIRESEE